MTPKIKLLVRERRRKGNVKSDKICKLIAKHRSKVLSNADNHNIKQWLKVQVTGKVTEIWLVLITLCPFHTDANYSRELFARMFVEWFSPVRSH